MTLVELLVSMFILGIVMLIFGNVLASVQRAVVRQDNLSRTLDQARLAMQQLDREMRSGNVVYDPANENGPAPNGIASCNGCQPGFTLRLYTQANADTRATTNTCGGSPYCCTLWKIDTAGILWTRQWPPGAVSAGPWRQVASGLVNRALDPTVTAFSLDTDPLKGYVTTPTTTSRTINVTLAVNSDYTHSPTQTVRVQAALTGRNTSYRFPTNVCATTPPEPE